MHSVFIQYDYLLLLLITYSNIAGSSDSRKIYHTGSICIYLYRIINLYERERVKMYFFPIGHRHPDQPALSGHRIRTIDASWYGTNHENIPIIF